MRAIPSYRAAHLGPYLEFLGRVGAPVAHGLRQAGLPTLASEDLDALLPMLPTLVFLDDMRSREAIDDMSLRALKGIKLTDLSPSTVAMILSAPTLHTGLERFTRLAPGEDTGIQCWMTRADDIVKLHMTNHCVFDPQLLVYEDWNELLVLVEIVKAFAGRGWIPKHMGFRSNGPIGRYAAETFPDTRFLFGEKSAFITLPPDLLSQPPRSPIAGSGNASVTRTDLVLPPDGSWDFSDSLKQIMASYLCDGSPTVELAAELAGVSVRTLQRRLKQTNLSFSALIKQARFERASVLLREGERKIIDVAYCIGYSDPAHFTRAFKQIAGISPADYRHQHRSH